ncbi:glycosyltransferase [Cellulomonas sp. 179-A 4D5 NHS]|uniref:glycosyltransferase n=1 Tax=Cellulomonas sp. 179-A 4D5 NHS TaxID=3142378 RepID=UPI0039A2A917
MSYLPGFTLLTVATTSAGLRRTFASLLAQTQTRWQWVVAVAPHPDAGTVEEITELAALDPRVSPVRSTGDSWAHQLADALGESRGRHVALVEPGDTLADDALEVLAAALGPGAWTYTDEGTINPDGSLVEAWLKPAFSPELLRSQPYAVALAALPLDVVREVGGASPTAGTAAWYDLVLRVSEATPPPVPVVGTLYHRDVRTWPDEAPWVTGSAEDRCRAVAEHCRRVGIAVTEVLPVEVAGRPVGQRVVRPAPVGERVSVIIPTRGGSSVIYGFRRVHVVELLRTLWREDRYPDLELVVVHDTDTPPEVLAEIEAITDGDWVSVPFEGPFDFARKCNVGAVAASGSILCFLNDDMEVRTPGWLHELTSLLDAEDVGIVGARLLFADGTLQHAGLYTDLGVPSHLMFHGAADTLEMGGVVQVTGERSAVTGACQVVRTEVFHRLGGFSLAFPLNYNDVDLCLKARAAGLRVLYTPHAELDHYESQTRTVTVTEKEVADLQRRWRIALEEDPYINPQARRSGR